MCLWQHSLLLLLLLWGFWLWWEQARKRNLPSGHTATRQAAAVAGSTHRHNHNPKMLNSLSRHSVQALYRHWLAGCPGRLPGSLSSHQKRRIHKIFRQTGFGWCFSVLSRGSESSPIQLPILPHCYSTITVPLFGGTFHGVVSLSHSAVFCLTGVEESNWTFGCHSSALQHSVGVLSFTTKHANNVCGTNANPLWVNILKSIQGVRLEKGTDILCLI